jgi:hypothetical protein
MLIPQFSLRWLLGVTALCAGVSLILSFAIAGENWAIGAAAALGSVAGLATLYAAVFLGAWLLVQVAGGLVGSRALGQSPFANKTPAESPFGGPPSITESPMSESPPPITG